ncbi:hypothetical protein NPIL_254251 [Nephila pilipes]|uniref:Uncharacterized protein n=1 Tax=Nephila pilipes TaxID=299642 RepID=A0A8X6PF47_NEPPI|nr:hypothetical protein NPIL_254251 [Nephila pilipes]
MGASWINLTLQRLFDMTSYSSAPQASCYKILLGSSELPLASFRDTSFSSVTETVEQGDEESLGGAEHMRRVKPHSELQWCAVYGARDDVHDVCNAQ